MPISIKVKESLILRLRKGYDICAGSVTFRRNDKKTKDRAAPCDLKLSYTALPVAGASAETTGVIVPTVVRLAVSLNPAP